MEMNQYLEMFIEESKEHLQACNDHLLELEKNPGNLEIINEIFRSAHTLKGMSATMGFEDLASLTHQMENVLDAIRNEKISVTSEVLDIVFMAVDDLEAMVYSIADGGDGKKDVSEVVRLLKQIETGQPVSQEKKVAEDASLHTQKHGLIQTFNDYEQNIITQSLEQGYSCIELKISLRADCLLKAARVFMVFDVLEKLGEVIKSNPSTEMLEQEAFDQDFSVTVITAESAEDVAAKIMKVSEIDKVETKLIHIGDLSSAQAEMAAALAKEAKGNTDSDQVSHKEKKVSKSIRVNIDRLDRLMNLFEELIIDKGRLEQISKELKHTALRQTVEHMSRLSGDLQDIILKMRMVPIDTVFNRFPRMVRQLAKDLHKEIEFKIEGAETELDRTVIDEIGDPLVHLIRNGLDHGIETPEVRKAKGKNPAGTLELKAYHSGNHVFIEIKDDGAGINREKVLQKAISKGIVSAEDGNSLTDSQVYQLIFSSGFSTAEQISDISGRGVGLDVVKSTIESLGGVITIESEPDNGSLFSIQLPMTLSILTVLLVELEKEKYAIPLSSIIETLIISAKDMVEAHNQKVMDYRGKVVPLVFLKELFKVPVQVKSENEDLYPVVVVRKGDKQIGLVVDAFIGQQEVVLKPLSRYLGDVKAISGATILGDGQVALIVDSNAFFL
ncbi:two-component system chemotaxis sensor kinase CheA [Bacillus oleivorans]|uniref:Chemotaxis protein CheA n=1 Tax=Bacillus oleivorans TaxID=1448271 RepID=A0A285D316_9BACI|nr:chemotaxis protein CheA [Bacillus oleivorans]SNX73706.1 two-component system chemotaxis sensor kinase CheA [Bacillus oleivorans]